MSAFRQITVLVYIALVLGCAPAQADKRVALIIGNSAYQNVPGLPNPANDAPAVADLFKAAGFDTVQLKLDLSISTLRNAVSEFSDLSSDADIAVVYYAGHGMEIDGTNYLVPVDAKLIRDFDVDDETLSLDRVLRAIEPARRFRLVILDACRDNPFIRTMKRSMGSRSIGRGLAKVEPTIADTLIAFAAKAGSVALDGTGNNSPFTTALLRNIATPGLDVRLAFGRVRDDVLEITGKKQEPFVYGSLGGSTISIVPNEDLPPSHPPSVINEAAQAWAATKDTASLTVLEAFIAHYGGSFYADLARARIEEMRSRIAAPSPPGSVLPPGTLPTPGDQKNPPGAATAALPNTKSNHVDKPSKSGIALGDPIFCSQRMHYSGAAYDQCSAHWRAARDRYLATGVDTRAPGGRCPGGRC